jgi:hypothetical protein
MYVLLSQVVASWSFSMRRGAVINIIILPSQQIASIICITITNGNEFLLLYFAFKLLPYLL